MRELLDYSTAVFDADGRNIAQAARMPVHLNSMELCLDEIVARHVAGNYRVAMIGFNTMAGLGWVDAKNTVYAAPRLIWWPKMLLPTRR